MVRKMLVIVLSLLFIFSLAGCSEQEPPVSSSGPGRMVRRIQVAIQPHDPNYDRMYVTEENMNALLTLLRSMETAERPEQEPDVSGGQSCYSATVTFANGEQSVYYLLGHTYLRLGDGDWCIVDTKLARQFVDFLMEHPSDDDSAAAETPVPATE